MIETTVESIRVSLVTQNRVVLLKEVDGDRHLPIWIGVNEADAILIELQGIPATRPLAYDLMRTMLGELDATVTQIHISELREQVYFARIMIDHRGKQVEIDSRPSDAIALAVRTGSRIFVADAVMDQAAVAIDTDDADLELVQEADNTVRDVTPPATETTATPPSPEQEEGLSVFRDFINSLDLDDFDKKRSN